MSNKLKLRNIFLITFLFLFAGLKNYVLGEDKIFPDKPNPPRLVNDFAHCLNSVELAQLETKLDQFAQTTSTQISVITIKNLGGHDVEEYSVQLFNNWKIGQAGKNNGVLLLISLDDHKAWITVGSGLEGVLTDAKSGIIFRNEIVPAFKQQHYFEGIAHAADAIIAVTKGEYTADGRKPEKSSGSSMIVILVIFIMIFLFVRGMFGGGNRRGRNNRGGGLGNIATGMLLGELLGGIGGRSRGGWMGGGDSGGGFGGGSGGFGGFGGGSSSGGGAGGSW